MNKKVLTFALVALTVVVALYWLTSDTKAIVVGDLMNNQEELTLLAEDMLDSTVNTETALFEKYSSTYDIIARPKQNFVQFTALAGNGDSGFCYTSHEVVGAFTGELHEIEGLENWYWFEIK